MPAMEPITMGSKTELVLPMNMSIMEIVSMAREARPIIDHPQTLMSVAQSWIKYFLRIATMMMRDAKSATCVMISAMSMFVSTCHYLVICMLFAYYLPAIVLEPSYSHSIVEGGLEEISYTTRLTPRTSLTIRLESVSRVLWGM